MKLDKIKLEELISKERTLGKFVFDEEKETFFTDVEVQLYIAEIEEGKYQSEFYYFDGYEISVDEEDKIIFEGDLEISRQKAIDSYNSRGESFMEYPIYYTNVSCYEVEEE